MDGVFGPCREVSLSSEVKNVLDYRRMNILGAKIVATVARSWCNGQGHRM